MRTAICLAVLAPVLAQDAAAARVWKIRVEEPTGLYRRTREVVRVPLAKIGAARAGFTVVDEAGKELPWQVAGDT